MKLKSLSTPQQNIWYMKKTFADTSITNIGGVYKINGYDFNPEYWSKAINLFIANNDAMRIRIKDGNNPTQFFAPYEEERFEVLDLSNYSEKEKQDLYDRWTKESFADKLYKFKIIKFSEKESGIFFLKDHIITDAFSEGIMLGELTRNYLKLLNNEQIEVEPKLSYEVFLDREIKYRNSDKYQKDCEFWQSEFDDEPTLVGVSYKKSDGLQSGRYSELLNEDFTNNIKYFCSENQITPAVFFEALIFAYLRIISDENRITIGMPVLNRANRIERTIAGMFVNTVPFALDMPNDLDFKSLCRSITNKKFKVFKHQQYPFSDIQKDLKERFSYTGKLFDIVFSYQNASIFNGDKSVSCKSEWIPSGYVDNSLLIHVDDRDGVGQYAMNLEYQTSIFTEQEVKNILERLKTIAYQVFKNNNIDLKEINILSSEDIENYEIFNSSEQIPITQNVVEAFEEQVKNSPNNYALIYGDDIKFTYDELNKYANSLANTIRLTNLKKGSIIPIVGDRSYLTIIALLAIAKAGYAYCLLDSNVYPKDRIDSLINTCNAEIFITYNNVDYTNANIVSLDISKGDAFSSNYENLNIANSVNDDFVILHTSGSAGVPKATRIPHEGAVNMSKNNSYLIEGCDYGISLITMTFDAFTMDVLLPLLNGKTLVLSTPDEQKSMSLINRLVGKYKKTYIALTPTRLKQQLKSCDDDSWRNVVSLVVGGETFGEDVINLINEKTESRLYNSYGPTETTVFNCSKEIVDNKVTLGKPIINFKIIVTNKNKQLLPPGLIGEIIAIGKGVAKGYLGEDELTSQNFFVIDNERAYCSGDQGIINNDNELEYKGRKDSQYKINGVRFEASEIENLINLFPGIINSAVALKKHNGIPYIVAFFESNECIEEDALTAYLEQKLPSSIMPSFLISMDKLPVTRTGKIINRDLFPDPNFDQINEKSYMAPENETQQILHDIWKSILLKERIGINTSWKSLGGSSLELLSLLDIIEKKFNTKIKPSDLPKSPTINFLDKIINQKITVDEISDEFNLDDIVFSGEKSIGKSVLLAGATGYLGSHILYTLLKTTTNDVYCLIRDKDKFNELMNYYFGDELDEYKNRIHLIQGDIAKANLGLNQEDYDQIKNNVGTVVNAAANVKHYGPIDEFKGVNVTGVYNLLRFCAEVGVRMHQISTISVSGQGLTAQTQDGIIFTENDLDIGQKYKENIYVWTKYIGEKLVRDFQKQGLEASVYRVGHITNRNDDNLFQYNADNSGFKLLTQAIEKLGILPDEIEFMDLQSVTVDACANAIVALMNHVNLSRTYHIYDSNIKTLGDYLNANNIKYKKVSAEEFVNQLTDLISEDNKYALILQYFKDMTSSISNNTITNENTTDILNAIGFYYNSSERGSKSGNNNILHLHSSKSKFSNY